MYAKEMQKNPRAHEALWQAGERLKSSRQR